ncbi:MAG: hypothetical protein ACFWT6_02890 [Virgibacillus proomii]
MGKELVSMRMLIWYSHAIFEGKYKLRYEGVSYHLRFNRGYKHVMKRVDLLKEGGAAESY